MSDETPTAETLAGLLLVWELAERNAANTMIRDGDAEGAAEAEQLAATILRHRVFVQSVVAADMARGGSTHGAGWTTEVASTGAGDVEPHGVVTPPPTAPLTSAPTRPPTDDASDALEVAKVSLASPHPKRRRVQ